ncbi:Cy38.1 [Cynomolgus cytomegalovirus]|nr:Cy38.1 [Cynomolgus cytomegalovirus]
MQNMKLIAILLAIGLVAVHALPRYTTQDKDGITGTDVGNPDGTQGDDSGVSKIPITLEGDDLPSGDDIAEEGSGDEIPAYDVFIEGEMNDGDNSEESDEGSTED